MKNKKAIRLLLFAHGISGFAQGISILAIPWYFTDILKEAPLYGLIYAITNFISLFWGIYVGTIVDKFSRKNIFLILCITGIIVLGGTAAIGYVQNTLSAFFVGLVFTYTMLNHNIHFPTLYAFGQEMSLKENYGKLNAQIEITQQTSTMVAGALAAILLTGVNVGSWIYQFLPVEIEAWPIHRIFLYDGFSYLIAVILISFISYQPLAEKRIEKGNAWQRLKTGISFLKDHPNVFLIALCSYAVFLVVIVEEYYLLSLYAAQHLKVEGGVYAMADMCLALGAVMSGFLVNRIFRRLDNVKTIIILMLFGAFSFIWCSFENSITVLFIASVLMGITNAGIRIVRSTYLFNHIPNYIIGRSTSVFNFINTFFRIIILLLFTIPFFSENGHVTRAFFVCGLIILACIIPIVLRYRKIIDLRELS